MILFLLIFGSIISLLAFIDLFSSNKSFLIRKMTKDLSDQNLIIKYNKLKSSHKYFIIIDIFILFIAISNLFINRGNFNIIYIVFWFICVLFLVSFTFRLHKDINIFTTEIYLRKLNGK
jgi:hypothetical protein